MIKEKYTLEYYQEKEAKRKAINHANYLKKKYNLSAEEHKSIIDKRKNELLSKVLEMSQKGFKNIEIALAINVRMTTVSKYKQILKQRGFYVDGKAGRPSTKE